MTAKTDMVKTYNVGAFGIPTSVVKAVVASNKLPLVYTRHALSEAVHDRYGVLEPSCFPKLFYSDLWTLVEAETLDGKLSKFVVRRTADATRSLVLVILVDGAQGLVKTLWTNLNTDSHATLDKSKFSRP